MLQQKGHLRCGRWENDLVWSIDRVCVIAGWAGRRHSLLKACWLSHGMAIQPSSLGFWGAAGTELLELVEQSRPYPMDVSALPRCVFLIPQQAMLLLFTSLLLFSLSMLRAIKEKLIHIDLQHFIL